MIRRFASAVLLVLALQPAAFGQTNKPQAAPKVRLTADKQELPEANPRAMTIKLAIIGTRLGALPEEACGRVWTIDSEIPMVEQIRRDFTRGGVDLKGFEYLGDSVAGFNRVALAVENGRVQKMILCKPTLSDTAAQQFIEKLASDSQSAPKSHGGKVLFKIKGIGYYARKVGSWKKEYAEVRHEVMGGGTRVEHGHTESGPFGIEVGVQDVDWVMMNMVADPKVLKSIQDGKLRKGMKPLEAYLAMKDFKLYRNKNVWTWTDKRLEMADMTTYSGDLGSSTVTKFKSSEKVIAKVTFVDGLVDTIEDEQTLGKPPTE